MKKFFAKFEQGKTEPMSLRKDQTRALDSVKIGCMNE